MKIILYIVSQRWQLYINMSYKFSPLEAVYSVLQPYATSSYGDLHKSYTQDRYIILQKMKFKCFAYLNCFNVLVHILYYVVLYISLVGYLAVGWGSLSLGSHSCRSLLDLYKKSTWAGGTH